MKRVKLKNGVQVILSSSRHNDWEMSINIMAGHISEHKLGLAAVYEKMVSQCSPEVFSVCGGNITAFCVRSNVQLNPCKVNQLYKSCMLSDVMTAQHLEKAKNDIIRHTLELAPLPMRQTKLAYKHTAFAKDNVVWDTEEYIREVKNLTLDDVKQYIADNYVGKRVTVGFAGPKEAFSYVVEIIENAFGALQAGQPYKMKPLLYTGGYQKVYGNGTLNIVMLGWDLSGISDSAETNVFMTILSEQLERCLAPFNVASEVKIAGYYGFRTLRICICTPDKIKFEQALKQTFKTLKMLKHEDASDYTLETSKQHAMMQRLAISNEALPRSVDAAWLLWKRNVVYNNERCINNIWPVCADDIRSIATDIFARKLTAVFYTRFAQCPSYEELVKIMND